MNIAGIIAEYNPFHSGHRYHLQQARQKSNADAVICIMSASFVQRGQPACFDKFVRARMALEGGADMVLELPCVYSLQSAEYFARGAVRLLDQTGIVTHLCFGVEDEVSFSPVRSNALRTGLDAGLPYCRALQSDDEPNSLLGQEYMRAIELLKSDLQCVQIKRLGAGHDSPCTDVHLSASEIRARLASGLDTGGYFTKDERRGSDDYLAPEAMFLPLLCRLRTMRICDIAEISQVSEGLEYLLAEAASSAKNLNELILMCKSKRYTYSRLARMVCCAFLGITSDMTCRANSGFPYIRVLGVKKDKTALLGRLCRCASLPVCVNSADFMRTSSPWCAQAFETECRATDLRAALSAKPAGLDYTNGLIVL